MGFLDHSTNNILIDAVLTDYGRKLLAENQGAFKIAFFSLADDEVDYSIIRKFGRTVGKEKISKNTPIYEAQTLSATAMKHRLITLSDPIISRLPRMQLVTITGDGSSEVEGVENVIQITKNVATQLTVKQQTSDGASVPTGMTDSTYTIRLNDRFLKLSGNGQNLIDVEPYSKIASYQVTANAPDASQQSSVSISIERRDPGVAAWTQFGDYGTSGLQITSVLSVIGDQSGLRKDFKVILKKVV